MESLMDVLGELSIFDGLPAGTELEIDLADLERLVRSGGGNLEEVSVRVSFVWVRMFRLDCCHLIPASPPRTLNRSCYAT